MSRTNGKSETSVHPLFENLARQGFQLRKGSFLRHQGRKISGIIDRQGRVYCPHPYDLPQNPFELALFAAEHLKAMMDTELINSDFFETPDDAFKFRSGLQYLSSSLELHKDLKLWKQPPR